MISEKRIKKGLWWERALSLTSGTSPISIGCDFCWARSMENRFQGGDHTVRFHPERLDIPTRIRASTAFAIWNDLFCPQITAIDIVKSLNMMGIFDRHTYLILTKRPERMAIASKEFSIATGFDFNCCNNIWFGTTAENQEWADIRIPHLLSFPGKKFVSLEPLLEEIDISPWLNGWTGKNSGLPAPLSNALESLPDVLKIDSVIVGGESGPKARPCKPEWIKSIINQCKTAGVNCFVKQLGNNYGTKRYRSKRADGETIRAVLGECPRELPWNI